MPKRKHVRVFQAWTPYIWSNSNLIRWHIWSELAAILSSFAGRGFRSRVWRIIRTARPPLTRLMSPLSEVAISILSQDRSDSVRSQLSLTYQKHWRQMLKSLTWMSGPWNQERISVSSKTPYCIVALFLYFTVSETACAPTQGQTSRLLCLRIYHLPATMAFNNFG